LRTLLNDSKSESINSSYDSIKGELDDLYKDDQSVRQDKTKLYAKRDELQKEVNALYDEKRAIQSEYRTGNENYATWKRENEARKKEEEEKNRLQEEQDRLNELIAEEREAAEAPAFESELNLCNGLLAYFGTVLNQELVKTTETTAKANNLPTLNIRKVEDSEAPKGFVVKKKNDDDFLFAGSKSKKKSNNKKETQSAKPAALKIPIGVMESLFSLKIQAPLSVSEVQSTVEKVQEKKQYYLDNQDRVTEEKKAKLESKFALLSEKLKQLKITPNSSNPGTPANGEEAQPIAAE
jgi:FtsZ-binding cell division protein ZapB